MSRSESIDEPATERAPSAGEPSGWVSELTAWLLSGSGLALIAAAVLIPAQHGLTTVREQRDIALGEESQRAERLERYERYLGALDSGDRTLLLDLAEREFGVLPEGTIVLDAPNLDRQVYRPDPFAELEPPEARSVSAEPRAGADSMLSRWIVDLGLGRWLIVGGAALIFAGVLTGGPGPSEP